MRQELKKQPERLTKAEVAALALTILDEARSAEAQKTNPRAIGVVSDRGLDRVRPHLDGSVRVVVAGSGADPTVKRWLADAGYTFIDTPLDLRPLYAEAAVVAVPVLEDLAGPRRFDPRWQAGLESMLAYAQRSGWIDPDGRVRAHIA